MLRGVKQDQADMAEEPVAELKPTSAADKTHPENSDQKIQEP